MGLTAQWADWVIIIMPQPPPTDTAPRPPLPDEAKVVQLIRSHLEGLFPKECPNCQRSFTNFREYLQATKYQGPPMSYDAELGQWHPEEPLGAATFANCRCGTTLVLTSEGMPKEQLWQLLNWAKPQIDDHGWSRVDLLNHLRREVRREALGEAD